MSSHRPQDHGEAASRARGSSTGPFPSGQSAAGQGRQSQTSSRSLTPTTIHTGVHSFRSNITSGYNENLEDDDNDDEKDLPPGRTRGNDHQSEEEFGDFINARNLDGQDNVPSFLEGKYLSQEMKKVSFTACA